MNWIAKNIILTALFILASPLLSPSSAASSWSLDAAAYHTSPHGRFSCLECHEGLSDRQKHPDAAGLKRLKLEAATAQRCMECHSEVEDQLAKSLHGGKVIKDPASYTKCFSCHDPHSRTVIGRQGESPKESPSRCSSCHDERIDLPPVSKQDRKCYACHMQAWPEKADEEGTRQARLCGACHGLSAKGQGATRFDPQDLMQGPHAEVSCLRCHPGLDRHSHLRASGQVCVSCHQSHHQEKITHDAHVGVSCAACHFTEVKTFRTSPGGIVEAKVIVQEDVFISHRLVAMSDGKVCLRCHSPDNAVGTSAMVLPAKSIICMPCHAATFSAGDSVTLTALTIFGLGLLASVCFWATGSVKGSVCGHHAAGGWGRRVGLAMSGFLLDGLLQRRLWRISRWRWVIHLLIFIPFVFRFTWGLGGLLGSLWTSDQVWPWHLINKNWPLTALLFDLSGALVLAGVFMAVLRKFLGKAKPLPGLPQPDWLALGLLLGIVLVGFVLEGMRMTMTGHPAGSQYAFVGLILSRLLTPGPGLSASYGYVWYAHAILTGAFVAYLPFSRMFHIVLAPLIATLAAMRRGSPNGY